MKKNPELLDGCVRRVVESLASSPFDMYYNGALDRPELQPLFKGLYYLESMRVDSAPECLYLLQLLAGEYYEDGVVQRYHYTKDPLPYLVTSLLSVLPVLAHEEDVRRLCVDDFLRVSRFLETVYGTDSLKTFDPTQLMNLLEQIHQLVGILYIEKQVEYLSTSTQPSVANDLVSSSSI